MADRNRPAVDIDALLVQREHAGRIECNCRKCFVDLHEVQVAGGQPRLLQRVVQRERRHCVQPRVPVGAHPVGDDFRQRLHLERASAFL